MFGMSRWYYNKTITWCEENENYNFRTARNSLRKFETPEWSEIKLPSRVFSGAVQDCCKGYKTSFSLLKNGYITHFDMRYRSKKDTHQTLYLEKGCFTKTNKLLPKSGIGKLKCFRRRRYDVDLSELTINHDCRLMCDTVLDKWFLLVPTDFITSYDRQVGDVISLDPGVRTFLTGYSPDGLVFEAGVGAFLRLWKLMCMKDSLYSKMSGVSKRKKKSLRKAIRRLSDKVKHLVDELHYKTIRWLLRFRKVVVGDIKVSSIIKKISTFKRTKRLLCSLRFYDFKKRLIEKAEETKTDILYVNESWTSKTCCSCGFIKHDLGSSKVYCCDRCNISIDRDVNGAINIYKKSL